MSRRDGRSSTRRPASMRRPSWMRPVSGWDIGTPSNRPATRGWAGSRRPRAQKPPSSAGPKAASSGAEVRELTMAGCGGGAGGGGGGWGGGGGGGGGGGWGGGVVRAMRGDRWWLGEGPVWDGGRG